MAREPLQSLLRLREIAFEEARRALRGAIEAESEADQAAAAAEAAIRRERAVASALDAEDGAVEAFGAWLPGAHATRNAAEGRRETAALATVHARMQLQAARGAVEAVRSALAAKAAAAAAEQARREQRTLDELGSRGPTRA